VVVVGLVDGYTPEVLPIEPLLPPLVEPGPPIELVLPDESLLLVEPGVPPPLVLPPMALGLLVPLLPGMPLVLLLEVDVSGAGLVVVVDELDELVGVPV
jgi:hypothetical protein